ncbi:MAG: hypothetical protein OEZ58_05760 [Gammaproteobacteria bacterium]|nr:hypothetical protein [Gammaproteobacteria bacterium]MDH5728473.1 hypothetical protein [Gammaproteobacteria bacterium]
MIRVFLIIVALLASFSSYAIEKKYVENPNFFDLVGLDLFKECNQPLLDGTKLDKESCNKKLMNVKDECVTQLIGDSTSKWSDHVLVVKKVAFQSCQVFGVLGCKTQIGQLEMIVGKLVLLQQKNDPEAGIKGTKFMEPYLRSNCPESLFEQR